MRSIICYNIFPDEKDQQVNNRGFYSIHSENKKIRRKKKRDKSDER
jgi:hypothetical protein